MNLKKIAVGTFEIMVRVGDIENYDFMEYGSLFYGYRYTSVWSAPEALKNPKKIQDVNKKMDVYSFGMILWEIWHESIPFDGEIDEAIQYVVNEESRPKIIASREDIENLEDSSCLEQSYTFCDPIISSLIRKCWTMNPKDRPELFEICQLLQNRMAQKQNQDTVIVSI